MGPRGDKRGSSGDGKRPGGDKQGPPSAPKPNLRVNSSAPRRASPSTCGSSRQRRRTGAINPQVSGGESWRQGQRRTKVSLRRQIGARRATLDVIPAKTSSPAPKRRRRGAFVRYVVGNAPSGVSRRRKRAFGRHRSPASPPASRASPIAARRRTPPVADRRHPVFCSPAATPDTVHRMR